MNDVNTLYKVRQREEVLEKMNYNKFIFNGHFLIFITIMIGAFALGYSNWLKDIPQNINYRLIFSVILSICSIFPMRTFFREADKLYLLPFEKHLMVYIRKALTYSYFNRLFLPVVILVIGLPLFYQLMGGKFYLYITVMILSFVFPILGLIMKWFWLKYGLEIWGINVLLFIVYASGYYTTLKVGALSGLLSIVVLIALIILLENINRGTFYQWETLIAIEHNHKMNYYKFVNMFTDVKVLNERTVRRRYLDVFLKVPSSKKFNQDYMYKFLFVRSFARGKDAFFIVLRLLIIGLLLIWWIDQSVISAILGALIMYLLILQLSQFYKQQAYGLWPQVWPVSEGQVVKGYHQFLINIMIVLGIILSIIYILKFGTAIYFVILFFIVGWLTIDSSIKKIKKHQELLRD
ncbi:ABC transporter permease [Mammaliicoccus sciuri]|uniref:Multidrug ABC transporter ATP-binding protein n=4 Tax=Mammaliicoccus sciuri TaxID=1296 RepID=A0AAI8GTA6_MAMSC|nr:ABC transporter permease [Mammaliicoccus sciuri]OOV38091.1 multidrug ABC transporter ATP-binding protein [Staphylococcus sp. MB371]PCQ19647.1 multidrug ABC transporter ATP-binding protein [Klebsiella pneumoniae]ASE33793.1 multidrug ABC transporter ATP-binding protein [Mammaliicoccus sciuri]KTT84176.1 multidrug ABC transporter ATP-binding protein [Mammaliicoccus sciuri]KTT87573.1 multidrug ABC transporter ATP-binding protein [Mammaliicoccus sciuri]